jgi:hypothetical protein
MSRNRSGALLILGLALALPAPAPAATDQWDDRCCRIRWAPDLSGPRDYRPGIALLNGYVKTAGMANTWYLTDERGNRISTKAWVCRGNVVTNDGTYFNAFLDTRRLKRGHLYYWILETKVARVRYRYAHPFRMPTEPIRAYAKDEFASRLRTRKLRWSQPLRRALAGKRPKAAPVATDDTLKPPSGFSARLDPSGDGTPLVVTFRNTTSSLLRSVHVSWNLGTCPTISAVGDLGGFRVLEPALPGSEVRIDEKLPFVAGGSRHVCVAAWSLGKDGSVSAGVTATFELPPDAG